MPYVVEDHYLAGIPQTALVGGLASRGIPLHWTAGATGRRGALATAQFFVDRPDRNASYHELWWWDAASKTFGVLRIVRSTRAAHSMNPAVAFTHSAAAATDPVRKALEASRFSEVRRILGDKAGDPNAVTYAPSFAGMPADLVAAMRDPFFVACAARRIRELLVQETTIKVVRPLFNHGWIQPASRYDAGEALIPAIYSALTAGPTPVQEDEMPTPKLDYVPQLWTANAGGAELREQADLAAPVVATVPAGGVVLTLGEAPDTAQGWRIAVAGDPERLLYVRRSQLTAMEPTPRDPELYSGIAAVVNARAAGQPVPIGGIPKADYDASLAQVTALTNRIATKDAYVAKYPKG